MDARQRNLSMEKGWNSPLSCRAWLHSTTSCPLSATHAHGSLCLVSYSPWHHLFFFTICDKNYPALNPICLSSKTWVHFGS